MGLITWLADRLGSKTPVPLSGDDLGGFLGEYKTEMGEFYIRELAFFSALNLIASAVAKCEFKTFVEGEETKGREYWLWNYEPNRNQNSSAFIRQWIAQLYFRGECLIIEQNRQLLVADSFIRKPFALYDDVFTQVTVGDLAFDKAFYQPDVLYYSLGDVNVRNLVVGLYAGYARMLTGTMRSYVQNRNTKGVFAYETLPPVGTDERAVFDALTNQKIKTWLTAEGPSALPLGKGQSWKENTAKTYAPESTRDIRAMIDDVSDYTAKVLGIPPALLRGDVQGISNALEQFLTFCVDPLLDMLGEEINRKRGGLAAFREGTYLRIDSKTIRHIDLLHVAASVDKLIGSGAFSPNEIRQLVDYAPVEGGDGHFITKNYALLDFLAENRLADDSKGGERT